MVRSAAAALAVLILPSFVSAQEPAQEPVGTHTVIRDDTLWDLAQRYYSNPFEWRVIWNANRDVVADWRGAKRGGGALDIVDQL